MKAPFEMICVWVLFSLRWTNWGESQVLKKLLCTSLLKICFNILVGSIHADFRLTRVKFISKLEINVTVMSYLNLKKFQNARSKNQCDEGYTVFRHYSTVHHRSIRILQNDAEWQLLGHQHTLERNLTTS